MTFKDRTSEFNSVVQGVKQRGSAPSTVGGANTRKTQKQHEKSQFFVFASQIGRDITETAEKLDRLTKLAKRKSLFDDPTIEIQELTSIINQDIKNLNNQISVLQQRGSERQNKQIQQHSDTVLDSLKSKLRDATKDFTEVLELRTEKIKQQQKERENFTGNLSPTVSNSRRLESPLYRQPGNLLFQGSPSEENSGSTDVVISMPQNSLMTQERYVSSRTDAVLNIEKTIGELQGIFQQLATLVAEQGEMIQRIDHNIEDTSSNVNNAQAQLLKYLSKISNNRWLVVKLFAILIFFVILFVVFFV